MARESTIKVLRSTGSTDPTGLTFGELAYTDANGKLFMGTTAGASLWIGAGITTGGIATNSATLVPTQSAVKSYVDGVVGGGSVVNSFNGTGGAITLTGSGAILNTQSGITNTISVRVATTGVTGVASFNSASFDVTGGAVSIKTGGITNGQLANSSVTVSAGSGLAGGGAVALGGSVTLTNAGVTGVVAGTGIAVSSATGSVTITNTGVLSFNGLTGAVAGVTSVNGSTGAVVTYVGTTGNIPYRYGTGVGITANSYFTLSDDTSELTFNGATGAGEDVSGRGLRFTKDDDGLGLDEGGGASIEALGMGREVGGGTSGPIYGASLRLVTPTGVSGGSEIKLSPMGTTVVTVSSTEVYINGRLSAGGATFSGNISAPNIVNSFNGATSAITLTGNGAILNTQSGGTNTISARVATTGVTGVASFNSASFDVTGGAVSIKTAGVTNGQLANSSVTVTAGNGLAGGGAVALGGSVTLSNAGVTGLVAGTGIAVSSATGNVTITNNGVQTFNGATSAITLTGNGAILNTQSGLTNTISVRVATTGVTGVASFNSASFDVTGGDVTIKTGGITNGQLANSSVTVSAGSGLAGGGAVALGGTITVTNAGVTGVVAGTGIAVSGATGNVTISNNGVQTFNGSTGAITLTGNGAILNTQSGGTNTISARVATTGVTGVASFNSASFDVTGGAVSIKTAGVTNGQLATPYHTISAGGTSTLNLGDTLTLTGGSNITLSTASNTVTLGLANDIVIAGNLTVNGTVVTANVDSFIAEDTMFALGTGNSADSLDIGFYGIYTNATQRSFSGLFRDASDSGKYKMYTGLTGAEPTTTVNTGASGYTVATLVVNIDGGTF